MRRAFFLIFLCCFFSTTICAGGGQQQNLPREVLSILKGNGEVLDFDVEMALSLDEQKTGMMFRQDVPPMTGMLFVFEDEQEKTFWMHNVPVPLDIIFIKKTGIIHHIHALARPYDDTPISSEGEVYAVLELAGGEAQRLDINIGDIVQHHSFSR